MSKDVLALALCSKSVLVHHIQGCICTSSFSKNQNVLIWYCCCIRMGNNKTFGVYLQFDPSSIASVGSYYGYDLHSHSSSKALIFFSLGLASAFDETATLLAFHGSVVDAADVPSPVSSPVAPSPVVWAVVSALFVVAVRHNTFVELLPISSFECPPV